MPGVRDFTDKLVVITGAGSGIGKATAHAFAYEGARLALADIDEERLEQTGTEVRNVGAEASTQIVDVANQKSVDDFAATVIEHHGPPDVLFNNAGVGIHGSIAETSLDDWQWLVNINYWGVVYGIKAFLPSMRKRKSGHIVNTASMAGFTPSPMLGCYSSTKFAVVGLGETLRLELKDDNIGVTTICPGMIQTAIIRDSRYSIPDNAEKLKEAVTKMFERQGRGPEHVARAILKGVRKNKAIVPVGSEAWILWYLMRFCPPLGRSLISRMVQQLD